MEDVRWNLRIPYAAYMPTYMYTYIHKFTHIHTYI